MSLLGDTIFVSRPAGPGSHRSGSRTPPAAPPLHSGATLVYSFDNLRVMNADTGANRTLPLPAPAGGASDRAMIRIGDSLLLNRGDRAWLYRADLRGAPVDLGPSLRIIPGPSNHEVWLWWDPCAVAPVQGPGCSSAENSYGQGDIQLVDLSGRRIGRRIALPLGAASGGKPGAGWFPTGDVVDGGLVLSNVYGPPNEEVWDPTRSRVIRVFPDGNVLASAGDVVAWMTNGPCVSRCIVHLTNVSTGIARDIPLPTGAVAIDQAAFSPDNQTLAIPVGIGGAWPGHHPTGLVLVDPATRTARLLPGSEQMPSPNFGAFNATWSNSGWLFYTAYGSTQVLAWHPGAQTALILSRIKLPRLPPPSRAGQQLPTLIAL